MTTTTTTAAMTTMTTTTTTAGASSFRGELWWIGGRYNGLGVDTIEWGWIQ